MWKASEKMLFLCFRMQFVYPSFLYAFGLIAIPIIIHLFNLVKPKKVVFSNTAFLREVDLKTSRKLKLKHLLILLSRILFVVFLVLTFAQPFIASNDLITKKDTPVVSIYIDNSHSMNAMLQNESVFNKALKEAAEIINQYPDNTKFQIVDNDFKANTNYLHQKSKALDYLTEVSISNSRKSANQIYKKQLSLIRSQEGNVKHAVWLTDAQKSAFNELESVKKDTSITHYFFDLRAGEVQNISIDTVYLESPFVKTGDPTNIFVKLRNSGVQNVSDVNVKLLVNDKQLAQTNTNIDAGATQMLELQYVAEEAGEDKLRVVIDDNGLLFDNTAHLVLSIDNNINILSISDSSSSNLNSIYKNESSFNFSHQNVNEINFEKINTTDLLILEELDNIPKSLIQLIKPNANFNLLVVPSQRVDATSYATLGSNFGAKINAGNSNQNQKLQFPNLDNPLFTGVFTKKDDQVEMPIMSKMISTANGSPILKYQDGSSAVVQFDNMMVCTGPLSGGDNSFINHSFIVPFLYKLAMMSSVANRNIYYTIGASTHTTNFDTILDKGVFTVSKGDLSYTPDQLLIGNSLSFKLNENDFEAGFYDLKLNNNFIKNLAFNVGLAEGDLAKIEEKVVENFNDKVFNTENLPSEIINISTNGVELWKWCLILAILFLLVEILLIRFLKA